MSDDITQKLRVTMPDFKGLEISCPCRIRSSLMTEAADKIERQARHIEELREKIDAERSCGCSFDAPGDVCVAHSPALMQARAEVERLTEWQSINHSEQHKLGWSMTEFCEGKRDHLHEMWERPPSLDYGIAHIEAEIKRLRAHNARLRAHNARLRAQVSEYFSERETHPVEDV